MMPQLVGKSREAMNAAKVPAPLRHLVPAVQRWGAVIGDGERYNVADAADADDRLIAELERFAASWTPAVSRAYEAWSDDVSITDSHEAAKFYFTLMLLDELEIRLPQNRGDPVEEAIRSLGKMKGLSAVADRMWAAQELAERGEESKAALPALREAAASDPAPHVRAWAHAALALIEGNEEERRRAIREILAESIPSELDQSFAASALEELDRTPEERARRRMTGASITGDVKTLRKLIRTVDVNRADDDGSTPIQFAVNGRHAEAVAVLLEAGANPNQTDAKDGSTLLHDAAASRYGAPIIRLLLDHGADPTRKDTEGQTPLDVARERGRKKNVELLQARVPGIKSKDD